MEVQACVFDGGAIEMETESKGTSEEPRQG